MILDLVSMDMYVSYNIKLAHKLGLQAAVYITELLNINRKAIQKEKMIEGKFFKIKREYVEERTTLSTAEQKQIDKMLEELGIIEIGDNKDTLTIKTDALTGLLLDNSKIVDKVIEPVKRRRLTKAEAITNALKEKITTTNPELRMAYEGWIEAVMSKQGWMSTAGVVTGQQVIDNYSNRDLDIALKIVNIAATNGYRDMTWAINDYEKKGKNYYYNQPSTPQPFTKDEIALNNDEVF